MFVPQEALIHPNVHVSLTHFQSGLHDMQLNDAMRCSP